MSVKFYRVAILFGFVLLLCAFVFNPDAVQSSMNFIAVVTAAYVLEDSR